MSSELKRPLNWMLPLVIVAVVLEYAHADPLYVFLVSAGAIVPLAGWMGRSTEWLAARLGAGAGGLLNATFGNAAELIIAVMGLRAGLNGVVKASITGSIIGNILLVLGVSIIAGGLKRHELTFNRTAASLSTTLLGLSAIALVVPALFHRIARVASSGPIEHTLSLEISIVLAVTYVLNLLFSLRTHKHLYEGEGEESDDEAPQPVWLAISVLLGATALVALLSEFLVGAIQPAAQHLGMSDVFVGVFILAIVGNAAEHSTAVMMARRNKMDLAFNIAAGSSLQVALFVAPLLVFISYGFARPMDLIFSTFEVVAVVLSVAIVNLIALDGESNWMEGVLLLAVYSILGLAFYTLPS